ncbi:hypothetical protein MKW98_021868 [Papaver atlanticum]|uniref:Protein kinase domain-containing protein n=1 Tax=Papaver atlanticum TaxID=357466 RepID=A0AAD4SEP1_9MAGN|nr:hypothetical protein MKW98_021868 [Papaver atlanticum]
MGITSSHLFIFIYLSLCFLCVGSAYTAFTPIDNLLFNCGGNKTLKHDDGRAFVPDSKTPNLGISPNSHVVVIKDSKRHSSKLYNTARLFKKTSSYTIRTKHIGRHWLRLHFSAVNSPLKSSVFSIVANAITLSHEFSFAKSANGKSSLLKEYVINLRSHSLTLTLSPLSNHSVAFINGIEIISLPDKQFPSSVVPIPLGPEIGIPTHAALETVYRLNMGGPLLPANYDPLWRTWVSDHAFLLNPGSARSVSMNPSTVKYPAGVSVNIAPNMVYATAQEMADANVGDQRFNISWSFKVDSSFSYLIRMHFCDIVSIALNNLIFNVYINNQSAINSFDISSGTNQLSAAYYVDFISNVSSSSDSILVQVGPPNQRNVPPNAIFNGLEIMKLSDSDNSLDGILRPQYTRSKTRKKKRMIALIVVFSLVGSSILMLIIAGLCRYLRRQEKKPKEPIPEWQPLPTHAGNSETKVSMGSFSSVVPSQNFGRVLAFSEIRDATNNFDESLVIGVGGFGKVYKGVLENGALVAVKRGNSRSQQGLVEFKTEIEMLSKLRHRHLVSLIGYCEELNEMILVYECMAGGPLRRHLYGSGSSSLSWKQRLDICIGAAKGLHYLHTGAAESIIHRDVKTTNILLDDHFTAKVADFGLSKLGPTLDQTHVSTAVKGSFGYLDPEYFRRQQLSEKSDVYSFGVVLMEVLCARPAINPSLPREQVNIAEWAMQWQRKGQLEKIVDPHLIESLNLDSLRKFGETAEKCLAEHGVDRPTMGDVLWNLEYALQLQEASTLSVAKVDSANSIPDLPECISRMQSVDLDSEEIASESGLNAATTSAVFSQLMRPKGR